MRPVCTDDADGAEYVSSSVSVEKPCESIRAKPLPENDRDRTGLELLTYCTFRNASSCSCHYSCFQVALFKTTQPVIAFPILGLELLPNKWSGKSGMTKRPLGARIALAANDFFRNRWCSKPYGFAG
jgi:hypothetical protein